MSWDKNTVNCSEINNTMELLKELNIPYTLEVLGEVRGFGNNDDYGTDRYKIRRLKYKDKIILEQMVRNSDCDSDDIIISQKFDKDKVPKKWRIERKDDE